MDSTDLQVTWSRVCAVADLSPGEATIVDVDPPIAVFNVEGEFHAIDDTCTHDTYSLAEGYLDGAEVECALHYARFDVRTGVALCLPAVLGVRTYAVKVDGNDVFVDVGSRDYRPMRVPGRAGMIDSVDQAERPPVEHEGRERVDATG